MFVRGEMSGFSLGGCLDALGRWASRQRSIWVSSFSLRCSLLVMIATFLLPLQIYSQRASEKEVAWSILYLSTSCQESKV